MSALFYQQFRATLIAFTKKRGETNMKKTAAALTGILVHRAETREDKLCLNDNEVILN
jgi:hypothetical protein